MFNAFKKTLTFITQRVLLTTMSTRQRYFENPKPDFDPKVGSLEVPYNDITGNLKEILHKIERSVKPVEKNGGDGVYLGTAGIAYMYYHLSKIPALSEAKSDYLNKAVEYIKPATVVAGYTADKKKDVPSFILGNCGVYAVASAVYKAVGDERQSNHYRQLYYEAACFCKEPKFLACGSDELFIGRAGYILGALWLAKETNTPVQKEVLHILGKIMVQSGRDYARQHRSACPLMYAYYQVEYLGAAHGLCSILQVLMSIPEFLDSNPADAADIKQSVDFLLSIQSPEGNFPAATDEIGYRSELVHWCHGAGGMAYLMAKAYLTFNEEKYLDSCKRMADLIWCKGLLKKGPGICHGIAGNGYVLLLLYRLTREPKYLYRAVEFYKFMGTDQFLNQARIPDSPYSLYEGLAGTACYVADLTNPLQATFPFSDVF